MSVIFVWDDTYSVGNADMDSQHQYLFELASNLSEIKSGKEARSVIMELSEYARNHFVDEEKLMECFNFPLLAQHKKLHEEVGAKLNEMSYRDFDDETDFTEFKLFIYNWLLEHVLNEDMKYTRFMRNREAADKFIK